jgi:hypothetical protein
MKFSLALALIFIALTTNAADLNCGEVKPQWLKCATASDCTIVADHCGWPKAVANTKFSDEVAKVNRCVGSKISCPTWDEKRDGKWSADCKQQTCVVVAMAHSPQSECESKGGRWEGSISGRGRLSGCNMPTKDAGKSCTKGEDCESVCTLDRKCYGWLQFKGCGFFKGRAQSMCVE